jgi:hypothetical protein
MLPSHLDEFWTLKLGVVRDALAANRFEAPWARTGRCMDCQSPSRICNTWVINEKSYPPGRIAVVLINRDLGL